MEHSTNERGEKQHDEDLKFIQGMTRETPTRDVLDVVARHPSDGFWQLYSRKVHMLFPEVRQVRADTIHAFSTSSPPPRWEDLPGFLVVWLWSELTTNASRAFNQWLMVTYAEVILPVFNVPRMRVKV